MKRASRHGPAIVRGAVLPATNKMDDLQPVAIRQDNVFQRRTRDDFKVALHRHFARIKANVADKVGNSGRLTKAAQITIQRQGDRIG